MEHMKSKDKIMGLISGYVEQFDKKNPNLGVQVKFRPWYDVEKNEEHPLETQMADDLVEVRIKYLAIVRNVYKGSKQFREEFELAKKALDKLYSDIKERFKEDTGNNLNLKMVTDISEESSTLNIANVVLNSFYFITERVYKLKV